MYKNAGFFIRKNLYIALYYLYQLQLVIYISIKGIQTPFNPLQLNERYY